MIIMHSTTCTVHYNYNALCGGLHEICSTARSFDLRCESVTLYFTCMGLQLNTQTYNQSLLYGNGYVAVSIVVLMFLHFRTVATGMAGRAIAVPLFGKV